MTTLLEPTSSLDCPPRFTTPRSVGRRTLGGRVAEVAELLGTPLMPWQRHVADVALEVDPGSGRLAYREVVLTVPRQSGKTTLMLAVKVHRALGFGQRQKIMYTAQTRLDARKKWEDEHVPTLERSPLRGMFTVRRQIGQEAIRWRNGSIQGLAAPSEKAVHGDVLDLGAIDEAFAQEDDRVEQGMKPAMITRPQPQLWIFSTAGTLKSVYLREKVEAGRLATEAGITSGVAYFEWSAPPEADPGDPETWYGCMPALGRTVREDAIAADFQTMKLDEFRRAYLNQWPMEAPDEWSVITQAQWSALAGQQVEPTLPVAFAADMTPDMSWGSIGVAWRDRDGLLHVEIPEGDHRPGTAWMAPRLLELYQKWQPCAVAVAAEGPAASLLAPLAAVIPAEVLLKPGAQQRAAATGQFYEAVTDSGTLRHLDQPELAAALAGARQQFSGDLWWWARKGLNADVSPLVAVTLAAWGLATRGHLTDEQPAFAATWR
jgi:hypothetical protein